MLNAKNQEYIKNSIIKRFESTPIDNKWNEVIILSLHFIICTKDGINYLADDYYDYKIKDLELFYDLNYGNELSYKNNPENYLSCCLVAANDMIELDVINFHKTIKNKMLPIYISNTTPRMISTDSIEIVKHGIQIYDYTKTPYVIITTSKIWKIKIGIQIKL